jgi:hypothetical protein
MGGGGMRGGNFIMPEVGEFQGEQESAFGGMFDMALMQQAMQILTESGGVLTDEVKAQLLELGLTEELIEMFAGMMQGGFPGMGGMGGRQPDNQENMPSDGNNIQGGVGGFPVGGDRGGGGGQGGLPSEANVPALNTVRNTSSQTDPGNITFIAVLLLILIGSIAAVAMPRRNVV